MAGLAPSEEEIESRPDALQELLDLVAELDDNGNMMSQKSIDAQKKALKIAYDIRLEQIKALEKQAAAAKKKAEALNKQREDLDRKIEVAEQWFKERGLDWATGKALGK